MVDRGFDILLRVMDSEQATLSRTDRKAFSILSVLGVFMVFFIVYYRLLALNPFIIAMLAVYFSTAFTTIWSLVKTLQPRFRHPGSDEKAPDPTYFGGIRRFASSDEYFDYLRAWGQDEEATYRVLSRHVYALANINWDKNQHLKRGMRYFIITIATELLMILSVFIKMGLESL